MTKSARLSLALVTLSAANLMWPTSAPLIANGLPLNRSVEYVLTSLMLAWLTFVASRGALTRIVPLPSQPTRFRTPLRILKLAGILLGASLLLLRLASPVSDSFAARYFSPESPDLDHLFLVDNWYLGLGGASLPSRYEEQLSFDPAVGQTWRLGAFNDTDFNIYGSEPGTLKETREEFRKRDAHPFRAKFYWNRTVGDRLASLYPSGAELRIRYRGGGTVALETGERQLQFSRQVRNETVAVSSADLRALRLDYANFECDAAGCLSNLTMDPVPIAQSVFQVSLAPLGGGADSGSKPLSLALLAEAQPMISPARIAAIVETGFLAVLAAVLALGTVSFMVSSWPGKRQVLIVAATAAALWSVSPLFNGHISQQIRHVTFAVVALPLALAVLSVIWRLAGRGAIATKEWLAIVNSLLLAVVVILMVGLPSLMAIMSSTRQLEMADVEAVTWKLDRVFPPIMIGLDDDETTTPDHAPLINPAWDDSWLSPVGDDPRTYSAWSRGFMAAPSLFQDPTMVVSKPFFIYYRAGLSALFGDGDLYIAIFNRQLTWWCAAAIGLVLLAACSRFQPLVSAIRGRTRVALCALAAMSLASGLWMASSVVTYAAHTAAWQFSEGPAWQLMLLSIALLIGALANADLTLLLVAGTALAAGATMRTTVLPTAAFAVAAVWTAFPDRGRLLRAVRAYVAPILIAVIAVWVHAGAPLGVPEEVAGYYAANTGIPRDGGLEALMPDGATVAIALMALLSVVVAVSLARGTRRRIEIVTAALIIAIGNFLPVVPQLAAPYYPRAVMPAYYVLALVPSVLLVLHWKEQTRASDASGMPY